MNRCIPVYKEVCDCFALIRAHQHAITTYNVHMVDMDNHRPGPGRQMIGPPLAYIGAKRRPFMVTNNR